MEDFYKAQYRIFFYSKQTDENNFSLMVALDLMDGQLTHLILFKQQWSNKEYAGMNFTNSGCDNEDMYW